MEKSKEVARYVWDKLFGKEYNTPSFDIERKTDGIRYLIKRHANGKWTCDCPSFIYHSGVFSHKGHSETCKHIRFFMDKEEEEEE